MKALLRYLSTGFAALLLVVGLSSCASAGVTRAMSGPPQVRADVFPGNYWNYSMGPFHRKENFENVERAQWNSSPKNRAMLRANSRKGAIASLWVVQISMLKGDACDMIAMDSIADYAKFNWPGGLGASKDRASNKNLWRKAA